MLAPPKRFRAVKDAPLRLEICQSRDVSHSTRSLTLIPRPVQVWPINWIQLIKSECSPMAREIGVRSHVESYKRFKKLYLMSLCLTLSIIRYGSRVKSSNPGKEQSPPLHHGIIANEKGDYRRNFTYIYLYHHHVVPRVWISLTLSLHSSLSSI